MKEVQTIKSHWDEEWVFIKTKKETISCNYYVSNYGRIKSMHKESKEEKLLKGSLLKTGYKRLCLRLKGKVRDTIYVHRLVGENFIEKKSEAHEFLVHLDQNKQNNYYKNLKWLTREELNERWKELEIYKDVDFRNKPSNKMTESKVILLKKRLKKGKTKQEILAKQFDISITQVKRIESGENWGNVKV